jgi:murein DD-endopeptidase MepM/ murein hydrolase activator NlpD
MMRAIAIGIYATACSAMATGAAAAGRFDLKVPSQLQVSQGEIVELTVRGEKLARVEGRLGKEAIYFYRSDAKSFAAIIGADLDAKPGSTKISVTATDTAGFQTHKDVGLNTNVKAYRRESFTVAQEFDQTTEDTLAQIRREQADFARAFSSSAATRLWTAPFVRPVPQESSSSFGYRRVINGTPRAPHSGADLKAPSGTEVLASNDGRVVLAGDYFFAGRSIVLDHGGGLYTMYFHLSEFKVEDGATVRKGDVLGLSGMTGRVTGPHLHWGARLGNARIDPFELIRKISHPDEENPKPVNAPERALE